MIRAAVSGSVAPCAGIKDGCGDAVRDARDDASFRESLLVVHVISDFIK